MSSQNNGGQWLLVAAIGLGLFWAKNGGIPMSARLSLESARNFGRPVAISRPIIDGLIDEAADREGIPRHMLHALVHVESRKNPQAVSHVGARGLGQVMPFNTKRCGLRKPDELWDPIKNLRCSAQILREELDTYDGNEVKALQSYNGGPKCIGRCKESIQYSKNVLAEAGRLRG
jgi:soluble lytic murein transglycosylase-like protein